MKVAIAKRPLELGVMPRSYDPEPSDTARQLFGDRIATCNKSYDASSDGDAKPIYPPGHMRALRFSHLSIGR